MRIVLNTKSNLATLIGLIGSFQIIQYSDGGDANSSADTENYGDELIFTHSICRHGDRNVMQSYPMDPFKDWHEFWPEGYGQLTNLGKQQHYDLGKFMRMRYMNLLGDGQYSPEKVYVRSTDSDRSLMSSQTTVAGLFPPSSDRKWIENLDWQPIPIHIVPQSKDYILSVLKPCDRFDYEMAKYSNTMAYTSLFNDYKALLSHMEENSGKKLKRLVDILKLCDTLSVERSKGYPLPTWVEQIDNNEMNDLFRRGFSVWTSTDTLKKIRSGFLLKDMLDRFSKRLNPTTATDRSLRMYLYFAHDITIADMLDSLGIHMQQTPPLSSCLFFELYRCVSDPYVQIYYKNSTEVDIPPLEIPKCDPSKCSLKKLYELYDHILPKGSHAEECTLRDGEEIPPGGNPDSYTLD